MEKDLKTHQAKVLEHKYEIERLVQGLGQLKDQWFAIKRRERRAQVREAALRGLELQNAPSLRQALRAGPQSGSATVHDLPSFPSPCSVAGGHRLRRGRRQRTPRSLRMACPRSWGRSRRERMRGRMYGQGQKTGRGTSMRHQAGSRPLELRGGRQRGGVGLEMAGKRWGVRRVKGEPDVKDRWKRSMEMWERQGKRQRGTRRSGGWRPSRRRATTEA